MRRYANIPVAVAGAALAFATAGCGSAGKPAAAPPAQASGSPTSTAQAAPPGAAQPATTPPGAATGPASAACPVNAGALFAALKANRDLYSRAGEPATLTDAVCYAEYAAAQAPAKGASQPSWVFFNRDTTKTWRPLGIGSGGYCEGPVPREVALHFPGCP